MNKIVSTTPTHHERERFLSERFSHRLAFKPVFVGREVERTFLENYLDASKDGQGRFILISGRAGMGKTRLVQELMSTEEGKGNERVMIGSCRFQRRMTPYYPLRQILNGRFERVQRREEGSQTESSTEMAAPQFPWDIDHASNGFTDGEEIDRQGLIRKKLFYNMCQYLLDVAADCPLLIILENIQWADISSIQFLHFLARNIFKSKILVIATHDPDEPFSMGYGVNTILQRMARELLYEKLELEGLSEQETRRLVEWYFPSADFSEVFFQSIYRMSKGNPYLVRTALELLLKEGAIVESMGCWSNTGDAENYNRQPILEMVRRRLKFLDPSMLKVLECAAVIGDRFVPGVISTAMDMSLSELREIFESLEKDQRLLHNAKGECLFDHTLVAQALYSGMDSERRRITHERIGAAMEQSYDDEKEYQIYDFAFHYGLSGDREKALFYLEQAGDEARCFLAFQEALHFSTLGLSMFDKPVQIRDSDERKMRLLMFSGEMNQALGQWAESMEDYQKALVLAEALHEKKIQGEAFMRMGLANANRGQWIEAESFYAQSIDMFQGAGIQKHIGLVKTYDADIKLGRCEWKRAEELYEEALNTAMRTMNRRLMAKIYSCLGAIADIRGDLMGAMVNYSKSLNLYKGLEEYLGMANVYRHLGNMHANGLKWEKALEFYDKCINLYGKVGEVGLMSLAYLNKAVATLNLLAVGKAEKLCDIAERYLIQVEDQRGLAECNKVLGLIGTKKNEWHFAQRRFEESIRILESCGDTLGLAQNFSEIGSMYAAHNRNQNALELFQQAYDLYRKLGIDNRVEELRIKIKAIKSNEGLE